MSQPTPVLFMEGIQSELVCRALVFAVTKHADQKRKYTGEPYIVHPIGVAQLVQSHCKINDEPQAKTEIMMAAALLHDTVEDCGVTFEQIFDEFGAEIRDLVWWLTDCTKGLAYKSSKTPRNVRKNIVHFLFEHAPPEALVIKGLDIIHNAQTIFLNDRGFGPVYLSEVMALYDRIGSRIKYKSVSDAWAALKPYGKSIGLGKDRKQAAGGERAVEESTARSC